MKPAKKASTSEKHKDRKPTDWAAKAQKADKKARKAAHRAEKAARRAEKARAKVETHAAIVTAAHTGTAVEITPV